MSFTAIAHRMLKVRPRRGGGVASYFGGDLAAVEAAMADRFVSLGDTGRAGSMALLESGADVFSGIGALPSAGGFDYYIGPNGSDGNPGTSAAAPWSITAINTKRNTYAGKRLGLLDGEYNLYSLLQSTSGLTQKIPLLQIANGSAGSRTIVKSVNPRGPLLTAYNPANPAQLSSVQCGVIGSSLYGGQVAGGQSGTGYFEIDGLKFSRGFQHAIAIEGVRDWTVQNNEISEWYGSSNDNPGAIFVEFCRNGGLLRNNRIHHIYGSTLTANAGYGIVTFDSDAIVIENNTIYACDSGIYLKQVNQGNYTIRYNYIECVDDGRENSGIKEATSLSAGKTITLYNNIIWAKNPWQGRGFTFPGVCSAVISNNTFYGSNFATGGVFVPLTAGNLNFYGNIVARTGTVQYEGDVTFCRTSPNIFDFNCYPAAAATVPSLGLSQLNNPGVPTLYTLANLRTQTGKEANSIAANPQFAGATTLTPASFQLQVGSPCLGAGRAGGVPGGQVIDMGAWGGPTPPQRIGCNF